MKKKRVLTVFVLIALIISAVILVLVVRRRKNMPAGITETVVQSVKTAVSSAVPSGYVAESFPLKKGMYGEKVRILQEELLFVGFNVGSTGADSKFGTNTLNAVRAYYFNPSKTEVTELEWVALNSTRQARLNLKTW
jgi:pectin methylesterase-like acyl-CoA thioesterase